MRSSQIVFVGFHEVLSFYPCTPESISSTHLRGACWDRSSSPSSAILITMSLVRTVSRFPGLVRHCARVAAVPQQQRRSYAEMAFTFASTDQVRCATLTPVTVDVGLKSLIIVQQQWGFFSCHSDTSVTINITWNSIVLW